MAIKYAENTTYNQSGEKGSESLMAGMIRAATERVKAATKTTTEPPTSPAQTPPANVADSYPFLANSLLKPNVPATPRKPLPLRIADTGPISSLSPDKQLEAISPYVGSGVAVSDYVGRGAPSGTTLGEYEKVTGVPYSKITDPSTKPYLTAGKYLEPSEVTPQAQIKTLMVPGVTPMEGGQYLLESSKPGRGIATTRKELDWKENALIRQGLDPALFQIDHITPLWAGGADTTSNKEILDNYTHNIKTKVQSVPYTLMGAGLISQREALAMASQWKTKADTWGHENIPTPDRNGLIDLKLAKKISKEWTKTPKVSLKSFVKSLPEAGRQIYGVGADVANTLLPKSTITAVPREFVKGFASAIPTYDLAMPQLTVAGKYGTPTGDTTGKVSHVLGTITGNVVTFGWAYKLALKMLAKSGSKWAAKKLAGAAAVEGAEDASQALARLSGKESLEEATADMFGVASKSRAISAPAKSVKTGFVIEPAAKAGKVGETIGDTGYKVSIKGAAPKVGRVDMAAAALPDIALQGAIMSGLGQLHQMPKEDRAERAVFDMAYGMVGVGRLGYDLKGYSKIAVPSFGISLMEGLSMEDSFANAITSTLVNTGTMVGMHGLGHAGYAASKSGKAPGGILANQAPESVGAKIITAQQEKAHVDAAAILANKYRQDLYSHLKEDMRKKAFKPDQVRPEYRPYIKYKNTVDAKELQAQNNLLDEYLRWKGFQESWDPDYIALQRAKLLVSGKSLLHFEMSPLARKKAQVDDWNSVAERFSKDKSPDRASVPQRIKALSENTVAKTGQDLPPRKEDAGLNLNSEKLNNEFLVTGNNIGTNNQVVLGLIDDIESGAVSGTKMDNGKYLVNVIVSHEPDSGSYLIKEGVKRENAVRVYAVNKENEYIPVGSIASRGRIGEPGMTTHENSFNANRAKSVNKDFDSLTNDEMVQLGMHDPDINNDLLADEMRKNKAYAIKAVMEITPQTMSSRERGTTESFMKIFVNDDSWDTPSISKMTELMFKGTALPKEKAKGAVENISAAIKEEKPALISNTAAAKKEEAPINVKDFQEPEVKEANKMPPGFLASKEDIKSEALIKEEEDAINEFAAQIKNNLPFKNNPIVVATKEAIDTPKKKVETVKSKIGEENLNAKIISNESDKTINFDDPVDALPAKFETETNNQIYSNANSESWGEWDSQRINKGPAKTIDNALSKMEKGTPEYEKLAAVKKNFDRDVLTKKAKGIFEKNNRDEKASIAEFKADYIKNFTDNGLRNPLRNDGNDRAVTKLFRAAAYSVPKKSLTIVDGKFKIIPKPDVNSSSLISKLEKYNEENGTDIDILNVEIPRNIKNRPSLNQVYNGIIDAGYLPMGVSGNSFNTIWAVKRDKSLGSNADEFVKNLYSKVMGFPEGFGADTAVKRSKIFLDNSLPNPIQGERYTHHVLTMDENVLKSIGHVNEDFSTSVKNGLATKKAVDAVLLKSIFDGKIYITKKTFDRILKEGGYEKGLMRLKPTMDYVGPNGEKIMQKGDLTFMDDHLTEVFETFIRKQAGNKDFKISDNDVITFPDNIKVGLRDEAKKSKYSTFDASSDSYRFKYLNEPEEKVSFSLSNWAKFSNSHGINDAVKELYAPHVKKYVNFVKEINDSKTPAEGVGVLKKHEEYGKEMFGENLYGTVKKMVSLGAWHKSIGKQIDEMLNKVFQEKLMSGSFIRGNHLTLTPDFKAKLLPDGKRTFLSSDEVMISEAQWESLGKPSHVLTVRYPVTRITAMSKAKVLIAEKHGVTNLGKEQIIPNHFDTFVRKEGDYDADAFHIFAIGGKDGIPEKVANKIESIRREEGDMVMDPLEKFEETKLTFNGLKSISEKSLQGGESIADVSVMARSIPFLIDSGFQVGNMKPVLNSKNSKFLSEIAQFSVDSAKSPSLFNAFKSAGVDNAYDLVIKTIFTNIKTQEDVNRIKKEILKKIPVGASDADKKVKFGIQTPFNISDKKVPLSSNSDLAKMIKAYNKKYSNVKAGPAGEIMKMLEDISPYKFDFNKKRTADIVAAEKAVEKAFGHEYKESNNVKTFQNVVKKTYADYLSKPDKTEEDTVANIKKGLVEYYRLNEAKLTPEDKKSIHYWLATNPDANFAIKSRDKNGSVPAHFRGNSAWSNKLDEVIIDSPDIAKTYYEAYESYGVSPEAIVEMAKKLSF